MMLVAVVKIFLGVVFAYLATCSLYALIYSLAGRMGRIRQSPQSGPYNKFAVFIPCYKEDEVILHSAEEALKQDYPKDKYEVVVIADTLKAATVQLLKQMGATVVEVSFEKSTKARALNAAFKTLPEVYDYVLILDADNIMEERFLRKLNGKFNATKVEAIQGHRVAKNLNTRFAILDAISEEVNNHIYRKGHKVLGLSSGLIGSGMAFKYGMYKEVLKSIDAIGGFDKESELKLLKAGVKIEYAEDAMVYDEKVESADVFRNQRRRWISAQIHYFRKFFFQGLVHLFTRGNVDFFDKAFQQFLLPRVLLLGSTIGLAGLALIGMVAGINLFPGPLLWIALPMVTLLGILIAVPNQFYSKQTLEAVMDLPKAMILMFLTLFKLKGANKTFIHTPHSVRRGGEMSSFKGASGSKD